MHKLVDIRNRLSGLSDLWIAFFLIAYSLSVAGWLLANGIHVTMEDGFYYFKIAQNIAQGEGSSFDGINPTNGYHPLWLLCLVPIFWLTSHTATALLIGKILQAILMALGAAIIYRSARLNYGRFASVFVGLLWTMLVYRVSFSGLEYSLHALCVLAACDVYLRWFARGSPVRVRPYVALGTILSVAFLARLDTIMLSGLIGVWLAQREVKKGLGRDGIKRLLGFGVPLLLVCTAYAGINLYFFGYPLPVSSVFKLTWSAYWLSQDPHYLENGWFIAKMYHITHPLHNFPTAGHLRSVALGTFGLAILWAFSIILGRKHGDWHYWIRKTIWPWAPFALYSILSYLGFTLLFHQGISFSPWYFVIQPWVVCMVGAAVMNRLVQGWNWLEKPKNLSTAKRFAIGVALLIWCSVPLLTLRDLIVWQEGERRGIRHVLLENGARWAKENLPEDAIIGSWNAGTIGFLSERRVVNLDGFVNSWAYYESGHYDLCRYWDEIGITYLIDVFEQGQRALTIVPVYPSYAHCARRLELLWKDDRYSHSWSLQAYRIRPSNDE